MKNWSIQLIFALFGVLAFIVSLGISALKGATEQDGLCCTNSLMRFILWIQRESWGR